MENKFTSFAYEDERSTFTEGESRSRRSSILKPPKARAPLQEVNLGGSADETGDFDTLRKRRVSFAGVNSVKEFCSNAESAQVCHIQSYEETFSTSSDNSHSLVAKSQLETPKNASSTEDKNFADDPMDLTDSIIDPPIGANSSAQVVRVEPVLTASALTDGTGFLRNPQGQTWNARKSELEHEEGQSWNARSSHGANSGAGGEGYGANPSREKEVTSSHWSCSMEMTEPVRLKKFTSTAVLASDTPFHFGPNSPRPESDSGMEFTEAVGKMPNFLGNDSLGNASMEMTETIGRGRKSVAFTSSTNKSASMEFTEVVRKHQTPFNFAQSPFSGMELTEPVVGAPHEPMARHSLFTAVEKGQPTPRLSYSVNPRKSTNQSPGNKSSSDMDMTGVLSLSKASRLGANQPDDDMDFTQIVLPGKRLSKKARLSAEDEDDPFPIGRHLGTDIANKENLQQPLVELSVYSAGPDAEHVVESVRKYNVEKPVEEDDDTLAFNFNNVRRENVPVELSFLKEFEDSSPVSEKPVKSLIDLFSSKKPLKYDVPDDQLLLFSLSTTEDVGPTADIHPAVSNRSSVPIKENELLPSEPFTDDFLARPKGSRNDVEQLRGLRKSADNDNLPPMRMSFKDFEIKSDLTTTVMMNTSLSTVGLDDSNILKAGFNDLTCPVEQVPACASALDITAQTPRPSTAGNTSLAHSMMTPHVPGLDSSAENSPNRPEILEAETRKFENARDPPREQDNTTHTSFSRPFYMPIPDKLDSDKHGQSFPSLDLEATEIGLNHTVVIDASRNRQSMGPSVPRKSLLPQNMPESCSMELTDVLNQKPIPSVRLSMNQMRVSTEFGSTGMELSASICTDETLLRESLAPAGADEQSLERPSSMDETNLAEAALFNRSKKISQPAHDSPVSITSEETVCKSNVTNCAVERIETDSRDSIDTEETFARSKLISEAVPSEFVESAKNVPRQSQPHTKSNFFPGTDAREETATSELTDNFLINAGLNSTFSFQKFGSKGSSDTGSQPSRKSTNIANDFHDDTSQNGGHFFASHKESAPLRSEVPDNLMDGIHAQETMDFDHGQPKSRIRMSRKSNFFGNLFDDEDVNVEMLNVRPHDENCVVSPGKVTGHASNRKSAGASVEEVGSNVSRKSVRVIPISNDDTVTSTLPERDSENTIPRKSRGFSLQEALREPRKSGFLDLVGETLPSGGQPDGRIKACEEEVISGNEKDSRGPRESVKIISGCDKNESLPSNQLSEEMLESGESAVRKSIKGTPKFSNEGSSEVFPLSQSLGESSDIAANNEAECNRKSVGFLRQDDTQALRKSIKVTPNFSEEGSSETWSSSRPSEGGVECAIDVGTVFERKSVRQEVDSQAPNKSEITSDFNAGKYTETLSDRLEADSEPTGDESQLHRESVGFFGQEKVLRKSVRIIPETEFQGSLTDDAGGVDNPREDNSNEGTLESPIELPKRTPRKSCIGVKMDSSSEIEDDHDKKISLDEVSEEFEFSIKRNKRKSAVGVKTGPNADSDKESRNLEVDDGIKVSHDDVQRGRTTDGSQKMSPDLRADDRLSQGMMNVSINDEDINDFSDNERMHVSTPCKPRLSSRLRDDGRKRSLKPGAKSEDGDVHDLSQDLMNVSLESDTRSPMLKKTCASPQVQRPAKPNSVKKSLAQTSTLADKPCSARKSLAPRSSADRPGVARESLASQKDLFEQLVSAPPSTWRGESGMSESSYAALWGLSYDIRVKNRDFMAANGFTHLNRQIYEMWIFDEVIGLKATFSNCELDEDTELVGVTYTFKARKLSSGESSLDEEVFEFYKNRLLETLPQRTLEQQCRRVSDLFNTAQVLEKLYVDSKPLIERMTYLKLHYPCQINRESVEFHIHDSQRMLKFAVKIDLRSESLGEESISVANLRGQVKKGIIKLMFRVLTPREDMFYAFVKELRNNTESLEAPGPLPSISF